jgi:hypothetical protein
MITYKLKIYCILNEIECEILSIRFKQENELSLDSVKELIDHIKGKKENEPQGTAKKICKSGKCA